MRLKKEEEVNMLNAVFGDSGIKYTDDENSEFKITSNTDTNDYAVVSISDKDDDENTYKMFIINAAELLELSVILREMASKLLANRRHIIDPTPSSKKEYIRPIKFKIGDGFDVGGNKNG